MKFFTAIAALFAVTQAVTLEAAPESTSLVQKMSDEDHEIFEAIDADNSGTVSFKELCDFIEAYCKKKGYKLPKGWKKHVRKLFNKVDTNGDGEVTKKEVEAAMKNGV